MIKKGLRKKKRNKIKLFKREPIKDVDFNILDDGSINLKLGEISDEDLPKISICTPTGNRRWVFPLAIKNFLSFIYPKDRLEWIILDDGEKSIEDLIPRDKRITYKYMSDVNNRLPIADKRNKLVEMANHDYIVFMDDDDFYTPENLIARIKSLLKYQKEGVECVGCKEVASYDLNAEMVASCSNGDEYLTESTLAFTKSFWLEKKFLKGVKASEYKSFLEYRQHKVRAIPFQFVSIALTHGCNSTGRVRDLELQKKWKPSENWEQSKDILLEILDEETQDFLITLKKWIPK